MYDVLAQYHARLNSKGDLYIHLPRLYREAHGTVLELGVRGGNSTSALLAGVVKRGGHVYSVDIDSNCWGSVGLHPQWTFINADSLDVDKIRSVMLEATIDMLFIDTEHTYTRTMNELSTWGSVVKKGGKIFLHDTDDKETFYGVRRAIIEYCLDHSKLFWLYPGSNGLGVIQC